MNDKLRTLLAEQTELQEGRKRLETEHLALGRRLSKIEPEIHVLQLKAVVGQADAVRMGLSVVCGDDKYRRLYNKTMRLIDIGRTRGTIIYGDLKLTVPLTWLSLADETAVFQ